MVTEGPCNFQNPAQPVTHVPNKAAAMKGWCRCGKSLNQSARDNEDSPTIQRMASLSSVSTLSIRESHTDCTDITYRKPIKCQTCLNAEARNNRHMSSSYNTDHDFRPPDEILVNRRDLPPRPQRFSIPTTKVTSLDVVDRIQRHKAHSTVLESATSIPTSEESRQDELSMTQIHDLYHAQDEAHTLIAEIATENRFFPNRDPNESVLSHLLDDFEEGDLMNKIASDDTESSGAMWLMAVMDIDQVPSDERAGEELEKVVGRRFVKVPSRTVAENAASHRGAVCDLDLSPSDEGNLTSEVLPYTIIRVGRLLNDERDQYGTVKSNENLNSPLPRYDDQAHEADIIGHKDLSNVDVVRQITTDEHISCADSTQECESSRQLIGDPTVKEPNKPSVTERTAIKVDSSLLDGVAVSPESIQVGFEAEQQAIDQGSSSLNPFSWLCAA
ncbi:hypothetical protein MHU86_24071 [Fragilaria crotonensis]|nr:hypothetical protein MHU86_24071 [Fragilaria crotonensis]